MCNLDAPTARTYACYGFSVLTDECSSLLGFNGERKEPWGSCYALGSGYRLYSAVLMRFQSPDSYSPFGVGGINTYAYCADDPVNHKDPTGHMFTNMTIGRAASRGRQSRAHLPRSLGLLDLHKASKHGGNSRSPTPSPDRRSVTSDSSLSSREPSRSPVRRQPSFTEQNRSDSDLSSSNSDSGSSYYPELDRSSVSTSPPSSPSNRATHSLSRSPSPDNRSPLAQLEQLVEELPRRINSLEIRNIRDPGP
ncbi:RHS repeat-associated core domain-containing protein [Pseudomonas sp. NBRC 111124]|uniref:RHS repeat-associated core domain-containing protein n=1 Tax=Pseudomonas sp. NBRC 111124 TaxID=1661039 RepID=UPI003527A8AB